MEQQRDYIVPEENIDRLNQRIETLNKRAAKLKCNPIGISVAVAHTTRVIRHEAHGFDPDGPNDREILSTDAMPDRWYEVGKRTYYAVRVHGEAPSFAGWTLAAVINVVTAEDGERVAFLRIVPGETVPTEYRETDPMRCDHCRMRRLRNDTFIVRHEDGRWMQVGRQCLADFLGHTDPNVLAAQAELLISAVQACGEAGTFEQSISRFSLPHFLALTAMVVRQKGWMSKSKARELWEQGGSAVPTASEVMSYLNGTPAVVREFGRPTDQDVLDGAAATEWAYGLRERDGLNDYMYNVALVGRLGEVDYRTAGVAASILTAWKREQQAEAERAAKPVSEWQGTPGGKEKLELNITVTGCWFNQSDWGGSWRTIGHDAAGNVYLWYGKEEYRTGDTIHISAKVKRHSEWKGQKQTELFYVKVKEA